VRIDLGSTKICRAYIIGWWRISAIDNIALTSICSSDTYSKVYWEKEDFPKCGKRLT
jgi:hypothetical protein